VATRREQDAATGEVLGGSSLLGVALTIVRMAEERPKPDAEREPGYQERDWQRAEQRFMAMQKSYAREIDRATFAYHLGRAVALAPADRPAVLDLVIGKKHDQKAIDRTLHRLYATTSLEDAETRVRLYRTATLAELKKSKDPFIKLALAVRPLQKEMEERRERIGGAMALFRPLYVTALREMRGGLLAPDANSTLRVTYGTVKPPVGGGGRGFTTVSEMVAKVTGVDPFDAPARVVEAAKAQTFGPYADAALGELPVDFMSDVDTTNGNSGSPTLNRKGEIVGLLFDGTYDSVASDWMWLDKKTRSIHVDLRYVLWIMDAVDGADALLVEMGVRPSL
jgi:hypothetical protein